MNAFDQLYQEVILEHAQLRHGYGSPHQSLALSHQTNPTCGDEVTLGITLDSSLTKVESVSWEGQGCSISQASLSMMTDLVTGKSCDEVHDLWEKFKTMMHSRGRELSDDILDPLQDAAALQGTSQFPNRVKCALLGWMALRDAIAQAQVSGQENACAQGHVTHSQCSVNGQGESVK